MSAKAIFFLLGCNGNALDLPAPPDMSAPMPFERLLPKPFFEPCAWNFSVPPTIGEGACLVARNGWYATDLRVIVEIGDSRMLVLTYPPHTEPGGYRGIVALDGFNVDCPPTSPGRVLVDVQPESWRFEINDDGCQPRVVGEVKSR